MRHVREAALAIAKRVVDDPTVEITKEQAALLAVELHFEAQRAEVLRAICRDTAKILGELLERLGMDDVPNVKRAKTLMSAVQRALDIGQELRSG